MATWMEAGVWMDGGWGTLPREEEAWLTCHVVQWAWGRSSIIPLQGGGSHYQQTENDGPSGGRRCWGEEPGKRGDL